MYEPGPKAEEPETLAVRDLSSGLDIDLDFDEALLEDDDEEAPAEDNEEQ